MTDLKTLALAAKANNSDWYIADELRTKVVRIITDDVGYIAAASPDVILKLLEERDRLREALKQITEVQRSPIGDSKAFKAIGEIARQALATDSP